MHTAIALVEAAGLRLWLWRRLSWSAWHSWETDGPHSLPVVSEIWWSEVTVRYRALSVAQHSDHTNSVMAGGQASYSNKYKSR